MNPHLAPSSHDAPEGLPLYHPKCSLGQRSGYYPNISREQHDAVLRLKDLLSSELDAAGHSLYSQFQHDEEPEYLRSLRFLRARKFDVVKAHAMVKADIAWRADKLTLRRRTSVDILGCDSLSMYAFFPTWMQGFDKQLRPVSYRQFGKFEIGKVLQLTTMERLIRFHAWETEAAVRISLERSRALGYNVETFVLVVDASGWSLKLATQDAFTFIKGMASTDSDHYPERLGTMLLINAPSVLSFAWRVIQTFLDDVTRAKIRIMGSDPKEWQPVLFDLIDRGTSPPLPLSLSFSYISLYYLCIHLKPRSPPLVPCRASAAHVRRIGPRPHARDGLFNDGPPSSLGVGRTGRDDPPGRASRPPVLGAAASRGRQRPGGPAELPQDQVRQRPRACVWLQWGR